MSAKLWAGLFCLAVGLSIGEEAIAQDAESAKSQTTSKTEISRPIVDLVAQAEQAQGGKESSSSSKTKTESSSTSLSLSTTSTATSTSASSGATGGAAPRQPILPYNGTFDTSIPIKVPGFHGIEPKIAFHYNSAQGIRDFARPGGELGIGWNISGLSVIEAASTGRGVPKFDGTDSYLRDGWEIITCTSSMTSPSCTSGGTHVMRVESYERLKYDSSANTWEVTEKDGTKLLYKPLGDGQSYDTGNSTTVSLATKYRWLLRSVTDTHGNAVNRSDPNGHTFGSRSGDWGGNSNAHTNFNGGSNGCSCHGSSKSSGTAYLGNMPMKQSDKGVAELAFDRAAKAAGVSQTYGRVSELTGGGLSGSPSNESGETSFGAWANSTYGMAARDPVSGKNVPGGVTLEPGGGGGVSFPSTVPENVGPGRYIGESIPLGTGRPTAMQRIEINRIGQTTGCHTCGTKNPGTKSGNFIVDHQPPTALNPAGNSQRGYPHCNTCSRRQGGHVLQHTLKE